jgi:ABC-type transporter Mla subunit MlaD
MVRPWIKDIELTYTYPEYTGIAPFVTAFPSIEALYGTQIKISGEANTSLDSATIGFANAEDMVMSVDGARFQTEFRATESDSYQILLVASNGLGSVTPESWQLRVREDRLPEVELLFPGVDVEIPVSMQIPIAFHVTDDFGISRTELVSDRGSWHITGDTGTDTTIVYEWDFSQISLMPGEVMKYWIEVYDNDALKGPKLAKTREYRVYFPRIEEIYERLTQDETQSITELEQVLKDLQKSASQLEQMTSQSSAPLNPRDRNEVESMLAKMKEIQARADEVAAKLEQLHKAAENNWQVDRDLAEKLEELQQLYEEFKFPEMEEAIRKVDEALQKNPELLAQALENLKSTQEELKQRVERTIELLKKFRNEQLLKSAADKAKELEEWQADIVERTEQADSVSALAQEEDALSEEAGDLSDDLKELSKEMSGLGEKLKEEAKRASDTEAQLSKASDQLSAGKKALKLQRKALSQLSKMASNLSSMYQSATSGAKEEMAREIRKLETELLFLSFEEENIRGESLDMAFRQEAMIKGVKIARNQLRSLTNMTPFISQATDRHLSDGLASMEKAKQGFERKNVQDGEVEKMAAMASLNKAVAELMESEDALQQSCSASGIPQLMQRLSQLAQSQQSLNQLVQSMLPLSLMQSQSSGNQLQQLSAQQQALADELREIAQGLRGKVLGDLGGTAGEMEKIAQDMKKAIPRDIVERQRKVLKHLLDSQKSIYAKKHSRRRISEPGKDFRSLPSPIELDLMTRRGISQKEILESLRKEYPAEYEALIRAYFRALSTE